MSSLPAPPSPSGWLDIHTHFFPPRPASEDEHLVAALRDAHFMRPRRHRHANAIEHTADNGRSTRVKYFGLTVVQAHPRRFGLLAALPTDEPAEAVRNGVGLGDERLRVVWEDLNRREEVVFVHPDAYTRGRDGRPSALIDVAFDTARTITDMLYNRVFLKFPDIKWVFAHCGGAFPALSGRVALLGAESWVLNAKGVTREDLQEQMARIHVDTAAAAGTGVEPAIKMTGIHHVVYGADCGVPCSTEATIEENRRIVRNISEKVTGDGEFLGMNGFDLFPAAKMRVIGITSRDVGRQK
ncbi:hypothetical protein MGN70_013275 [Eutypa lata]|nr:hypothetical protein MGN70_013275 [Eutypa lata]